MIVTIPQGESRTFELAGTDAIWIMTTGTCRVTGDESIDEVVGASSLERRIGYFGKTVLLTVYATQGVTAYSDQQTQLLYLYAQQKGDSNDSSPADIANTVNLIINRLGVEVLTSTVSVDSIEYLPEFPQYDTVYNVIGYYLDSTVGGGSFAFDTNTPKSAHNGGTVIAPEALLSWDGTHSGLPAFFSWTGSGSGCSVRLDTDVSVINFGAVMDGVTINNTSAQKFSGVFGRLSIGEGKCALQNYTIDVPLFMDVGAALVSPSGATVTITSAIASEKQFIFQQLIESISKLREN